MKSIRLIQTIVISLAIFIAIFVIFNSLDFSNSDLTSSAKASIQEPNSPIISTPTTISQAIEDHSIETIDKISTVETITAPPLAKTVVIIGEITAGNSFDYSMRKNEVPGNIRHKIISAFKGHLDFRRLAPKDKYVIKLTEDKKLISCTFDAGPLEIYKLAVIDHQLEVTQDSIILESKSVKISGEITSSLFLAFANIDEGAKLVYAFADIFSSKIDFNTETQPGDSFTLLIDKYYKAGEFIGYGKIKAVEYNKTKGKQLAGFYYSPDNRRGTYFDQDGQEVGTSFIRSPVPMARVTSKFTYRRKHPITGRVQPHLGIDLAAPLGTPILAAGDGKIKFIGRNGGNGRQIVISHFGGYQTYYGHLARYKKGLKKGSEVNKKDIIGYVGSSGLSTGPHLDYRIKHNGSFKNPFSVEFKPKSELKGQMLSAFKDSIDEFRPIFNSSNHTPEAILQVKVITVVPNQKLVLL
jgi:murein DD-endopeptidase MepM/ murein hydrolase activator NlpD